MMKKGIYRAVIAIVVGLILVIYPTATLSLIIYSLGAMLIISSALSIMEYYKHKSATYTPPASILVGAVTSLLIGVVLVLSPLFLINFLLTLLSLLLLIGSVWQIGSLLRLKSVGALVSLYQFIIPSILLLLAISMLASPTDSVATITRMFGYGVIMFGGSEIISSKIK